MVVNHTHPCHILLAVDPDIDTGLLKEALLQAGHTIDAVMSGKCALDAFKVHQPNLIIMSYELPIYDGITLAGKIRAQLTSEQFIPIIMLSSKNNAPLFCELDAHQFDDHFSSPFDAQEILYKVNTLIRHQNRINTYVHKHRRLSSKYNRLQYEYDAAERCFIKIRPIQKISHDDIEYHMSPQSLSNGDILFYEKSPGGNRYIVLGDFTGHGLSAAISACSLQELFSEMVNESLPLNMIINEMNHLLVKLLQPEMYAATCGICIDKNNNSAEIWNGGLPPVYVYNKTQGITHSIASHNPPLGIEELTDEELETVKLSVNSFDRIFLTTDGLVESRNKENKMFGLDSYLNCIEKHSLSDMVFQQITTEINKHLEGMIQTDDMSYLEIKC